MQSGQSELLQGHVRQGAVCQMRRIKCAAKYADFNRGVRRH